MANPQKSLGRGLGDLIEEVSTVKAMPAQPAPSNEASPAAPVQPPDAQAAAEAAVPAAQPMPAVPSAPAAAPATPWLLAALAVTTVMGLLLAAIAWREHHKVLRFSMPAMPAEIQAPHPGKLFLSGLVVAGVHNDITPYGARLVPDEFLFTTSATFSPQARDVIAGVAAALTKYPGPCRIDVVGHTSNDPVRPGGPFRDHHDLGMRRALAALDVLRDAGLPSEAVVAVRSAGAEHPPFPNDFPGKARNRTVTFEVHAQ